MRIAMRPTDDDFPRYAHHRLEAFNLALDLLIEADQLCGQIKKPYRKIADQWLRAALGTFLLTCEGANRRSPGDKRYRFDHAHGECGEGGGAAEAATKLGLVPRRPTLSWLRRNARLNGLEQRHAALARSKDGTRVRTPPDPSTSTLRPPDPNPPDPDTSTSTSTSPPSPSTRTSTSTPVRVTDPINGPFSTACQS